MSRRTHHYGMRLGNLIRSTMPPLKRKITAGSDKRRVEFKGGPWDRKRGWLAVTITNTGVMSIGKRRGSYKATGVLKSYGGRGRFGSLTGPHYCEFEWIEAESKQLFEVLAI